MNAKYFDTILEVLHAKSPESILFNDYMCNPKVQSIYEPGARIELQNLGYIYQTDGPNTRIGITGKGQLYLSQGGFQKDEKLKNLPFVTLKAAKSSRIIAIIAVGISIASLFIKFFIH
jgi:hypothetical protein